MVLKTGQTFRFRFQGRKALRQGTSTCKLPHIRTICSRKHPSNTIARQSTCSSCSSLTQYATAVARPAKTKYILPLAQSRPRFSNQFKCSKGSIHRSDQPKAIFSIQNCQEVNLLPLIATQHSTVIRCKLLPIYSQARQSSDHTRAPTTHPVTASFRSIQRVTKDRARAAPQPLTANLTSAVSIRPSMWELL